MANNEMKRVNVKVSPEVYDWFKTRSNNTGVSMSALMFLALETHIQQQTMMASTPSMLKYLDSQKEE